MNLKKIIALVLCVCMVLSFFPVSVFAEDWEDEVVLVDEEECFEPQDEYVEEEIIVEEPADYVEYVEPAEELIVEEELIDEEPAAEEPAAEEPAAPAEEPAAPAEEPAAPAAELETAETFDAVGVVATVAYVEEPAQFKNFGSLAGAIAVAGTEDTELGYTFAATVTLKQSDTAEQTIAKTVEIVPDTTGLAIGAVEVQAGGALTVSGGTVGLTIASLTVSGGKATLKNVDVTGTVTATGGEAVITNSSAQSVTLNGGNVTLSNVDIADANPAINVQDGLLTIVAGDETNYKSVTAASTVTRGNIMGGKFYSADMVPEKLIKGGYKVVDADPFVKVTYGGVAKVGDNYYPTFAEAVAAAEAATTDKTITIYENTTYDQMVNGKPLTIQKYYDDLTLTLTPLSTKPWLYVDPDPKDTTTTEAKTYTAKFYNGLIGTTYYKTLALAADAAFESGVETPTITVIQYATLTAADEIELTEEYPVIKIKTNNKNVSVNTNVANHTVANKVDETDPNYTIYTLAPVVATIGTTPYASLADAVEAAGADDTIVLETNIESLDTLTGTTDATLCITKNVTLNLNNHNITVPGRIRLGGDTKDTTIAPELLITGTGTIETSVTGMAPVELRNIAHGSLTIDSGVTLTGPCYGLNLFGTNDAANVNNFAVDIKGNINGMVFVLGNLTNASNDINITVYGTAKIDASVVTTTEEKVQPGIALCGNAKVLVKDGATIKGESGIEVRAGSLIVEGGTITGTADYSVIPNNNGCSTKGAGVAIAQHGTRLPMIVTISGDTTAVGGVYALSEANPQQNPYPEPELTITGGTFTGTTGALKIEDEGKYVSGGTFSDRISEDYCADGYGPVLNPSTGKYGVEEVTYVAHLYTKSVGLDDPARVGYQESEKEAALAAAVESAGTKVLRLESGDWTYTFNGGETLAIQIPQPTDAPDPSAGGETPTAATFNPVYNASAVKLETATDNNNVTTYTATAYVGALHLTDESVVGSMNRDNLIKFGIKGLNGAPVDYIELYTAPEAGYVYGGTTLLADEVLKVKTDAAKYLTVDNFTAPEGCYIKTGNATFGEGDDAVALTTFTVAQKQYVVDGKDFYDTLEGALAAIKTDGKFTNAHNIEALDAATVKAIKLENLADVLVAKNFTVSTDLDATISQSTDDEGFTTYSLTAAVATLTSVNGKWNYSSFASAAASGIVVEGGEKTTYVTALQADETAYQLAVGKQLTVVGATSLYKIAAPEGYKLVLEENKDADGNVLSITYTVAHEVASVTYIDAATGEEKTFYGSFKQVAARAWDNRDATSGESPMVTLYAIPTLTGENPDVFTIPAIAGSNNLYQTGILNVKQDGTFLNTGIYSYRDQLVVFPPRPVVEEEGSATENIGRYFGEPVPCEGYIAFTVTEAEAYTQDAGGYYHYFETVAGARTHVNDNIERGWYTNTYAPLLVRAVDVVLGAGDKFVVNTNNIDMTGHVTSSVAGKYPTSKDSTDYPGATEWTLDSYVAKLYTVTYTATRNNNGSFTYTNADPVPADETSAGAGYEKLADAITAYRALQENLGTNQYAYIQLIADPGAKYKLNVDETVIYFDGTYVPAFEDPSDSSMVSGPVAYKIPDSTDRDIVNWPESIDGKLKMVTTESAATLTFQVDTSAPTDARFYVNVDGGKWYGNSTASYITSNSYIVKGEVGSEYVIPGSPRTDTAGYEFDGWYKNNETEPVAELPTEIPAQDTTYTAKWKLTNYYLVDGETGYPTFEAAISAIQTGGKFTADHTIEALENAPTTDIELANAEDVLIAKGFTVSVSSTLAYTLSDEDLDTGFTKYTLVAAVAAAVDPNGSKTYKNSFAEAAAAATVYEDSTANYYVEVYSSDDSVYPLVTGTQVTVKVIGDTASYRVVAKDGLPFYADPVQNDDGSKTWTVKKYVASYQTTDATAPTYTTTFKEAADYVWENQDTVTGKLVTLYVAPEYDATTPDKFEPSATSTGTVFVKPGDEAIVIGESFADYATLPQVNVSTGDGAYFGISRAIEENTKWEYSIAKAEVKTEDLGGFTKYFKSTTTDGDAIDQANTYIEQNDNYFPANYAPVLNVATYQYTLTHQHDSVTIDTDGNTFTAVAGADLDRQYAKLISAQGTIETWGVGEYVAQIYKNTYTYEQRHDGTKVYSFEEPVVVGPESGYKSLALAKEAYDQFVATAPEKTFYYIVLLANPVNEAYQLSVNEVVFYYPVEEYIFNFDDPSDSLKQSITDFTMTDLGVTMNPGDQDPDTALQTVKSAAAATLTFKVDTNAPTDARFTANAKWYGNSGAYYITSDAYVVKGEIGSTYVKPSGETIDTAGYVFDGWYKDNETVPVEALPTEIPTEDATYTAKWKAEEYAITFSSTGKDGNGSDVLDVSVPTTPTKYTVVQTPLTIEGVASKTGYTFLGWKPEGADAGTAPATPYVIPAGTTGALTLVPYLQNKTYTITFNYGEGALPAGTTNPGSRWVNSDANTINNPVLKGSTFTGWTIKITADDGTERTETFTVSDEQRNYVIPAGTAASYEFTANYSADTYTIKFFVTGVDDVSSTEAYSESSYTLAGVTAKALEVKDLYPTFAGYEIGSSQLKIGGSVVKTYATLADVDAIDSGSSMVDREYHITYAKKGYSLVFKNSQGTEIWRKDSMNVGDPMPVNENIYAWVDNLHGYEFKSWVMKVNYEPNDEYELTDIEYTAEELAELTMPAENVVFEGTVKPIRYTLTLNVPEGTDQITGYTLDASGTKMTRTITVEDCPFDLPAKAAITLPGYVINNNVWLGSDEQPIATIAAENLNGDVAVYLNAEKIEYPVAYYNTYGGTTKLISAGSLYYGDPVYFTDDKNEVAPSYGAAMDLTHNGMYLPDKMWLDEDDEVVDPAATITGAASYYLNWLPYATITFKDGETVLKVVNDAIPGTTKLLEEAPDEPARVGTELFWLRADGTTHATADDVVEGSETLTADWVNLTDVVTVTFDPANGEEPTEKKIVSGDTVKAIADPVRAYFTFDGWYADGSEEKFDFDQPITESVVLTAKWNIDATKFEGMFGSNASLDENINLWVRVRNIPEGLKIDNFSATYTVYGGEEEACAPFVDKKNGTYSALATEFNSYEMWKTVVLKVYFSDGKGEPVQVWSRGSEDPESENAYSLQKYFENQHATGRYKDLYAAALSYGAAAQRYFADRHPEDANPDKPVDANVKYDLSTVTKPTNATRKSDLTVMPWVDNVGAALRFEGDIRIIVKIRVKNGEAAPANLKVSVPAGWKVAPDPTTTEGNILGYEISGIKSNMYSKDMTVTISDGNAQITYTYSVFTYAANKWSSTDTKLVELVKSVVAYGNEASAVFH